MIRLLLLLAVAVCAQGAVPKGTHGRHFTPKPAIMDLSKRPSEKISFGQIAERGQFPYVAGLHLDGMAFCGGALVSNDWILSAAHCAEGYTTIVAYLGANRLDGGEFGHEVVNIGSVVSHHSFDSATLDNDIALLKLKVSVSYSTFIQPVTLPAYSDGYISLDGMMMRMSGWGHTSEDSTAMSITLNYVDLMVIPESQCQSVYGSYIRRTNFCARGSGVSGICDGDTGGPLVNGVGGPLDKIFGIASFTPWGGCTSGDPAAFTNVISYLDWVEIITGVIVLP